MKSGKLTHRGKRLDARRPYSVDYGVAFGESDEGKEAKDREVTNLFVNIEDPWHDVIALSPAQALSLLAWLEKEKPILERWVKEEQQA